MLHLDLPTPAEIEAIAAHRGAPAVTLYLPTTPVTPDAQADRIALGNLLREAVAALDAAATPKRAIWPIEAAVTDLIEDDAFWAVQANSLAIFATPDGARHFRLPSHLQPRVTVADRFLIKPLLRAVTFPQQAWVLAMGMGAVRLLEVAADLPVREVRVAELPRGLADAAGRGSHLARDRGMASGEATSESALLRRYARAVDQALRPLLAGHGQPLVLAATEPVAAAFRAVCGYPGLAPELLGGSPDDTPDHALAERARAVLDARHAAELATLRRLFEARRGEGRATSDLAQAARAATFGAIATLIVDMDAEVPGELADADGALTLGGGAGSVTDEITRRALATGARALAARRGDIPGGGELAAILRYAI
ncbi:MAG: hypothetical protein MUF65_12615 [Rubritepida sp.]|nr:hypothetical protein [Rubritepida sp.]